MLEFIFIVGEGVPCECKLIFKNGVCGVMLAYIYVQDGDLVQFHYIPQK
jgi:hypothetical protein